MAEFAGKLKKMELKVHNSMEEIKQALAINKALLVKNGKIQRFETFESHLF